MIKDINAITPEYMKHRIEEETQQYKQEIERLNKELEDSDEAAGYWQYERDKAINKIDKAIEYIENNTLVEYRKVIEILKGSDYDD